MGNNMAVSIVVPVYNNADSISQLLAQIELEIEKNNLLSNSEIILIDDFSSDGSIHKILSYRSTSKVTIVLACLKMNHGQIYALKTGFSLATGDAIVTLSADLQDNPTLISEFLSHFNNGFQIIMAVRQDRQVGQGRPEHRDRIDQHRHRRLRQAPAEQGLLQQR